MIKVLREVITVYNVCVMIYDASIRANIKLFTTVCLKEDYFGQYFIDGNYKIAPRPQPAFNLPNTLQVSPQSINSKNK